MEPEAIHFLGKLKHELSYRVPYITIPKTLLKKMNIPEGEFRAYMESFGFKWAVNEPEGIYIVISPIA